MNPRRGSAGSIGLALAGLLLLSACSSGDPASSSGTQAPESSGASAAASVSPEVVALTAAACGEINRLTREEMDGLVDDDASHWERFAVSLQSIADGSADRAFGAATTEMATAALRTSESLRAGKPLGPALTAFEDALPAVDSACKAVGAPLN